MRRMSPAPSVTSASIPPGPSFTLHKPEWDSQQRGNCRNAPLGVAAAVMPAPQAMIRTSTTSMPCNTTAIVWHAVARRRKHVLFSIDHVLQAAAHVALPERREAEARAARLQRRDDLADVVADEAEAHVARVLLHHCTADRLSSGQARLDCRDAVMHSSQMHPCQHACMQSVRKSTHTQQHIALAYCNLGQWTCMQH